jgi:hypothetical protein
MSTMQLAKMARLTPRRALVAALIFFIFVKLVWVMLPVHVMGVPRLGDDALVYLWVGASTVATPKLDQPAIRDIEGIRKNGEATPPALEFARARVTMRTTGVSSSPVAMATGGLLAFELDQKSVFGIVESATAVVLALAIAYLATSLVGPAAAAATLGLLAIAILPNQGLHYLIPGVFVLALSLVLWALVLKRPGRWFFAVPVCVAMLLVHPIGQVYALVAFALVCGKALVERSVAREAVYDVAALMASVILWLAINAATGARQPPTAGIGGISFSTVGINAAGLLGHLWVLVKTQPVLFLLMCAGILRAFAWPRRDLSIFVLVGVLAGVVVSTVIVDIPGYPGELPSRALVALLIVACAVGCQWILEAVALVPRMRMAAAVALAVTVAAQVPQFASLLHANMNSRHQIYDDAVLRKEIAALPKDTVILWMDSDLAMMTALLAGADRLHALPYTMLSGPAALSSAITGSSSTLVATSIPERLNGPSTIGAWSLQKRAYGYGFDLYRSIALYAEAGKALPVFLQLRGASNGEVQVTSGTNIHCQLEAREGAEGWFHIRGCEGAQELKITSSSRSARIAGLSFSQPDASRNWPWGVSGFRLRAEPLKAGEAPELRFDLPYLFGAEAAKTIRERLGSLSLMSDAGGIVWFRVDTSQVRQPSAKN